MKSVASPKLIAVHIPFYTFLEDIKQFANYIERKFKPTRLLGVARGGLLVACWTSYFMKGSLQVYPVYVKVKCGNCKRNHLVDSPVLSIKPGDVIIDDIYDTGTTLSDLTEAYWTVNPTICFLYSKKAFMKTSQRGKIFVGRQIITDSYIILPFEKDNETS